MNRICLASIIPVLLAWTGLAGPARAHPHVWIEMTSAVGFDDKGQVTALGIAWTFDEFYSLAAVDGLDKNKDGKYDAGEMKELGTTYLQNLEKYRYFTAIELNGKSAEVTKASNSAAVFQNGRLTFSFRLPLVNPVDPKTTKLSFSSFDPSYYIDIQPSKTNPVRFSSAAPKACGFSMRKNDGPAPPMALNLSESLKQQPPADGIFGMLPVAIYDIRCTAGAVP